MPVVDASAVVELLLVTATGEAVDRRLREARRADVPNLIDLEVASALRRLEAAGVLGARRANAALDDLVRLPYRRRPVRALLPRIWALRETLTPYDAAYVALAEVLSVPLVTADGRLARSHGHRASIELVGP